MAGVKGAGPEEERGGFCPRLLAGVHRWGSAGVILSRIRQTRCYVGFRERPLSVQVILSLEFSPPVDVLAAILKYSIQVLECGANTSENVLQVVDPLGWASGTDDEL